MRCPLFLPMLMSLPVLMLSVATPASARESLGIFESWGAFRDSAPRRCYAIAQTADRSADRSSGRRDTAPSPGFATISNWPERQVRGQVHVRLSRNRAAKAPVTISIGDRRFPLVAGAADAWAADARGDAAIVAAMRSGTSMSVQTLDDRGRPFADGYGLRGAATAIDAAALGCARQG